MMDALVADIGSTLGADVGADRASAVIADLDATEPSGEDRPSA